MKAMVGVVIAASSLAVLYGGQVAHADPAPDSTMGPKICEYLDQNGVNMKSLMNIKRAVEAKGYNEDQSAKITGTAIAIFCPYHIPAIQALVKKSTGGFEI